MWEEEHIPSIPRCMWLSSLYHEWSYSVDLESKYNINGLEFMNQNSTLSISIHSKSGGGGVLNILASVGATQAE